MQNNKKEQSAENSDDFQLVSKKKTSGRPHKTNKRLTNNNKHHHDVKHQKSEKSSSAATIGKQSITSTTTPTAQQHSESSTLPVIIKQNQVSSSTPAATPTNVVSSYSAAVILNKNATITPSSNFYSIPHDHDNNLRNNHQSKNKKDSTSLKNKTNEKSNRKQQSNKKIEKKQPQMVVRKVKPIPQFFIIRKPMNQGEFHYENSSLKPIIPKEPHDEMGRSFYNSLKSFIEDRNAHVYDFPNTLNLNQRKKVHNLAEEFKLDHFSRGSNPFRYICVSKRDMKIKDEFQYFGYIGLFGHSIDELVRKFTLNPELSSNQPLLQKRIKRDGPIHHITIMTRPEINTAIKNMDAKELDHLFTNDQKEKMKNGTEEEKIEILMNIISRVVVNDYQTLGLGKITEKLSHFEGKKTDDVNETYFVIVDWPSAQKLRGVLGLEPYSFHITVAYKYGDIHGVTKDMSTQISSQSFEITNEFLQKKENDMENLLRFIGVDTRYARSLINLGWFNTESIANIEKMDLSDVGMTEEDQNKILSFVQDFANNYKNYKK